MAGAGLPGVVDGGVVDGGVVDGASAGAAGIVVAGMRCGAPEAPTTTFIASVQLLHRSSSGSAYPVGRAGFSSRYARIVSVDPTTSPGMVAEYAPLSSV